MEILMRLQGGNLLHGSLLVGLYVLTGTQLTAQGPGAISVSGIVVASDRSPLPDAILGIERNGQVLERVRSGSDGQFTFAAISAGPASITIRRLGYQQKRVEVNVENTTTRSPLQIELAEVPSDVETVIIEGETGRLQEFTDRRARNNFGYFFDQNDIRKKSPRFVSELFRAIPGARLQASRRTGNILELRNCTPRIWIDAVRAENAEIDELIGPSEIAGMEIYPSFAGVPAQYMDRESRACGVVLVWTRQK